MTQIKKCQNKIFENEIEVKSEFYLDKKTQKIILENYIKENRQFKEAYERYQKICRKRNEIEVF